MSLTPNVMRLMRGSMLVNPREERMLLLYQDKMPDHEPLGRAGANDHFHRPHYVRVHLRWSTTMGNRQATKGIHQCRRSDHRLDSGFRVRDWKKRLLLRNPRP